MGVPTFEVADRSENTTLVRKHSKGPALSKKHKKSFFYEETKKTAKSVAECVTNPNSRELKSRNLEIKPSETDDDTIDSRFQKVGCS